MSNEKISASGTASRSCEDLALESFDALIRDPRCKILRERIRHIEYDAHLRFYALIGNDDWIVVISQPRPHGVEWHLNSSYDHSRHRVISTAEELRDRLEMINNIGLAPQGC